MKKYISVIIVIMLVLCLSACGKHKALTTNEFSSIMSKDGYLVNDVTNNYKNNDLIIKATVAYNSDYQMEFYESKGKSQAHEFFDYNKQLLYDANVSKVEEEEGNYEKYSVIKDDKYVYISRIDNTIVFAYTNSEFKDRIDASIEKIGY